MKPLIGITSELKRNKNSTIEYVEEEMIESVKKAGGLPVFLSNFSENEQINDLALKLDGLILTGGGDVDPTSFEEEPHKNLKYVSPERDLFEFAITNIFLKMNKPILGICRGSQIINIVLGGNIYQDIGTQFESEVLQHDQKAPKYHASQYANLKEDTLLYSILKQKSIKINSYHHQAVKKLGKNIKETATATDNVIEGIESQNHDFVLGVQWHPEYLYENDNNSKKIFQSFVSACAKHNE